MFPTLPDDLSSLSDGDLAALADEFIAAFNEATADEAALNDETVAALSTVADNVELIRLEQNTRSQAAATRAEQLAALGARVNATVTEPDPMEEAPEEELEESEEAGEESAEAETGATAPEAPQPGESAEGVTADSRPRRPTLAGLRAGAPARTRPRAESPRGAASIVASIEAPGLRAGAEIRDMRQVAELLTERHRTLGEGNGDRAQVVRFQRNMPRERHLSRDDDVVSRIQGFGRTPDSIRAAGGLCAPVNNYYDQQVIADASRPVRDALANFSADRGGIRFNPPPTLAQVTSGVGVITAAQDASGSTKSVFTITCASPIEVDVAAIYNQLKFGNFGARAWPEAVEAWTRTALAVWARTADQFLLDGIAGVSTSVTANGLVGAGRELFARLGQAGAAYRSRNRTQDIPLTVLLPAWTLDLVQADFARTFTDDSGMISMSDADITALFGVRDLDVYWYLDSKTGGGQVMGGPSGGRTYTDAATTSGSATLDAASGNFSAADVGKKITGSGIPANATIAAVVSATEITLSANATATATGVTVTVGSVLAQFPTSVYAYMFPTGTLLHLDAGTLDLGLVRDSTLNASNQFTMFSESFENVARVGAEVLEIVLNLNPDGSYAAARAITNPINS